VIVIEDNFYPNPDEVRETALSMFFRPGRRERNTNFPGSRTKSTFSDENFIFCRNRWENLLNAKMQYFPAHNSNTAFTLSTEKDADYNWVHHDCSGYLENTTNMMGGQAYAAVIYLSPADDLSKGTGLFRSKETGKIFKTKELTKPLTGFKQGWTEDGMFDMHTYIGNVYNRCILYPAHYWHAPFCAGFGKDKKTGRLVQVGFFTINKK
tara:strand:+ start:5538 stop:6164 length:627 start_codon:yes stop_codon:yes gene_type:complete